MVAMNYSTTEGHIYTFKNYRRDFPAGKGSDSRNLTQTKEERTAHWVSYFALPQIFLKKKNYNTYNL